MIEELNKRFRVLLARESCGVLIVYFKVRSLVMVVDIEGAARELEMLLDQNDHLYIVLEMGALRQISSSFISKVISFQKTLDAKGGRLALCSMSREVHKAFKILNLHKVFIIAKDEYEAAAKLLEDA